MPRIVGGFEAPAGRVHRRAMVAFQEMKRSADERLLHERLSDVADASPARVALTDGLRTATFAEVWAMSGDIAARLLTAGLRPGEIVALVIPRSIEIVAAAFGVLRAGGVVFGMDPHAPAPRSERLMAASGARHALVSGSTPPWLGPVEIIDLSRPHTTPGTPLNGHDIEPSAPAFLIFTSGSTGDPKGVLISHAAAGRRADAERVLLSVDADTVYLYRTRTDLVGFLVTLAVQANGAPLVIVADQRDDDPRSVLAAIEAHGVTHAAIPPRLLREIIRRGEASRGLRSVRRLRCSGEPLPEDLAAAVLAALPECLVRDEYGATETAGVVAFRDIRRKGRPTSSGSAAGPGATLRVVDEAGADSEAGEIWVEGPLLALGYLGGDDEARQRFVVSEREGERHRAYRTGDRGRRQPDGTIRILGQVGETYAVGTAIAEIEEG